MKPKIEYERSSGNVFADLGVPMADEAIAKAELARQINTILTSRKLTQSEASSILGIDQPRVSALNNGRLSLFSLEKLMSFASKLGNEVEIKITPSAHSGIRVADAASSIEPHLVSIGFIGGRSIDFTTPMKSFYRPSVGAMKIDPTAIQEAFEEGELMVA